MTIDWDAHVLGPTVGVFGEPGVLLPVAGGSIPCAGVFDEAYQDPALLDPLSTNAVMPVFGVQTSQFVAMPKQGDQVRLFDPLGLHKWGAASRLFLIKETRPDGHGWAKLLLQWTGQS